MSQTNDESIDDSTAPLIEHLAELRNRILWSLTAFLVAMVICLTWLVRVLMRAFAADLSTEER